MSTTSTTSPPATPPPDPALAGLRARVFEAIGAAARTLGVAPQSLWTADDAIGRHGQMHFASVNDAGKWADWLHWPFAATSRDGKYVLTAYGRWLGFSWTLTGAEPLVPEAAPAHREG